MLELFRSFRAEADGDAFHGVVSEEWDLRRRCPRSVNLSVAVARFLLSHFEKALEVWVLIHQVPGGKGAVIVVDFEAKVSS